MLHQMYAHDVVLYFWEEEDGRQALIQYVFVRNQQPTSISKAICQVVIGNSGRELGV